MSKEIGNEIKGTETKETNGATTNRKLKIALITAVAALIVLGAVFAVSAAKGGDSDANNDETQINTQQQPENVIGEEAALETAIKEADVDKSSVSNSYIELETDDGIAKYEVEFYADNTEYSFEIDATTGNVISFEKENAEGSYSVEGSNDVNVTSEEAKNIAIKKAGVKSTDVYDMDLELEHGVYEVSFNCANMEYEVVVDADTGNIVHFGSERDY